jgi:hypothetical protein
MKKCTKCGICKPLDEFDYMKDVGKHRGGCKSCRRDYHAKYKRKRRESKDVRDKDRYWIFRYKYPETYCTFDEYQEARTKTHCDCCGVELGGLGITRKCVDHCHTTGRLRGTLCTGCNAAEGQLKTVERVKQLLAYMENHCEGS